jgi:hypothetical protein
LGLGDSSADGELRVAIENENSALEVLDALGTVPGALADGVIQRARATGPDLVKGYAELLISTRTGLGTEIFSRAIADEDRELRLLAIGLLPAAVRASPAARRGRWVDKTLQAALQDSDPSVVAGGVRASVELDRRDMQALVTPLLAHPNRAVRVEAAGAFVRWETP